MIFYCKFRCQKQYCLIGTSSINWLYNAEDVAIVHRIMYKTKGSGQKIYANVAGISYTYPQGFPW